MRVFSPHKTVRLTFDLSGDDLSRSDNHTGIGPGLIAAVCPIVSTSPEGFHLTAFPNVLSPCWYFP